MATKIKPYLESVPRLVWNAEETARRLGISISMLHALRRQHPLYQPDCDMPHFNQAGRNKNGEERKHHPLWSDDLLRLIAFAWSKTPQGLRQYTDDEAYTVWREQREQERVNHLRKAGALK